MGQGRDKGEETEEERGNWGKRKEKKRKGRIGGERNKVSYWHFFFPTSILGCLCHTASATNSQLLHNITHQKQVIKLCAYFRQWQA